MSETLCWSLEAAGTSPALAHDGCNSMVKEWSECEHDRCMPLLNMRKCHGGLHDARCECMVLWQRKLSFETCPAARVSAYIICLLLEGAHTVAHLVWMCTRAFMCACMIAQSRPDINEMWTLSGKSALLCHQYKRPVTCHRTPTVKICLDTLGKDCLKCS